MQTLAHVQSHVRTRQICMSEENKVLQAQLLMKHEKELSNLRSSIGPLHMLEPAVDTTRLALKAFTDQKSSSGTLDQAPKDHGFHHSRDICSRSGGVVAPDGLL
ncbi:hypothetical protein Tco_0909382 [Tanacetum coccineum]|uniref:Uncharacterized protein n=1 Tax=Tanacetum coccineum TaxID=301880 RepID=A0ABQ5CRU2_9ASTR